MENDGPNRFAAATRGLIVLPAGCGKTEMLTRLVEASPGRQLVLTHTHAGVATIRARMAALGVPSDSARVLTIAAWALEYAQAHPAISRFALGAPERTPDFDAAYRGATLVLSRPLGKRILLASYAGVAVDEYQDCSRMQHELVKRLAAVLPCRVVGDPMQSIFFFGDNDPVPWAAVEETFPRVEVPCEPRRWEKTNPALGQWLLGVRGALERGEEVRFDADIPGLRWIASDDRETRVKACREVLKRTHSQESVLVIGPFPAQCHDLARSVGGGFVSSDEQERNDLNTWARSMTDADHEQRAVALIHLAKRCMTGITGSVSQITKKGFARVTASARPVVRELHRARELGSGDAMLAAYNALQAEGKFVFRRQLWREAGHVLREWAGTRAPTFTEAARAITHKGRFHGTSARGKRTISRTLLAKGLEFDHVVVTGAGALDAENLYVALTRAKRGLTILSDLPAVRPKRSALAIRLKQGELPF